MTGIDEVILCDNKAKNVVIVTARLFNKVSVQKNELKRLGYFITIPKAISAGLNSALPFILCILTSHNENPRIIRL
ncbi:MAG: hypothetical protein L3J11_01285 [Draconibacterium sp.]|nr:hypothetical protein [Draconibacterium sp.]